MNQNEFGLSISFQGRRYSFAYGSQAFIFHTGTLNGFYESYGANRKLLKKKGLLMKRPIYAYIEVDDDIAFERIDAGPIPYLEKEFAWLDQSGIYLKDAYIADKDESELWQAYLNYLVAWAFEHRNKKHENVSPSSYKVWSERRMISNSPCRDCDFNDPDMGCTVSSVDASYACPITDKNA